ncbi:phage tail protein [Streptomyces sp. SL13]|uniref:Phage tail protein n=1 Tax=Streptantibioticus silvisoli TaxID=2705255 RepID=A0AA90JY90_9ACTN|nr:phage tail protein [Streptantibioticus silvisoli]MDI5961172.1 phage tail protein [Streptantibioticus silvisoli]MDI5970976.1 phage tail protein [Streptantibioticus silvisoli]
MSRQAVPGLPTRHPIGSLLPALYADDDLAQRLTAGLDTVLAPVFATLDSLPAYFDPRLAPADFVDWLAAWVGMDTAPRGPDDLRRATVLRALELYRWRGTRRGIADRLRLTLGVGVRITDCGGASWSASSRAPLAPAPSRELLVRVWPDRVAAVDEAAVRTVVAASCPVHLGWRVEVLTGPPTVDAGPEGSR